MDHGSGAHGGDERAHGVRVRPGGRESPGGFGGIHPRTAGRGPRGPPDAGPGLRRHGRRGGTGQGRDQGGAEEGEEDDGGRGRQGPGRCHERGRDDRRQDGAGRPQGLGGDDRPAVRQGDRLHHCSVRTRHHPFHLHVCNPLRGEQEVPARREGDLRAWGHHQLRRALDLHHPHPLDPAGLHRNLVLQPRSRLRDVRHQPRLLRGQGPPADAPQARLGLSLLNQHPTT